MRRILVVGPSWIGDTILSQPLLKLLHSRHPGLALDVLAPRWTLPLLGRMAEVRRAIESPFRHGDLKLGERRRLGKGQCQLSRHDQLYRHGADQRPKLLLCGARGGCAGQRGRPF